MYIVMELQKNAQGEISNVVTIHRDLNAAESSFHQVLAYAALSQMPVHAAVLLSEEGFPLRNECYKHTAVPTGELDGADDGGEE